MMEAHLLSQYSKEEAIALLQKFVSRSDSPGDETDSNVAPVPEPLNGPRLSLNGPRLSLSGPSLREAENKVVRPILLSCHAVRT